MIKQKLKFLVLVALLVVLPAVVQAQFTYTTSSGAITITGYTGSGGDLTIPDTIDGLPVTSIGDSAFAVSWFMWPTIYSVTIPSSVTSIGDYAFASSSVVSPSYLGNVYFQGNAPSVGGTSIFAGDSYATVYYLAGTTGWGTNFGGAPATLWEPQVPCAYSVNNNTISITRYMGSGGGAVNIPETINGITVTSIGDNAFNTRATTVTNITLPNTITSIGRYAFNGCTSITSLTIPNSVTNVGFDAFAACTSLTSITIGTNLTSIANGMFSYCSRLTSITIPSSVTNLDWYAFNTCTKLTGIYFWGNAPSLGSYVFDGDNNATIYRLAGATGWSTTFGGLPVAIWDVGPPVVISQPVSRIVAPGNTAIFTVSVQGPGPLAYQWRLNETNIVWATNVICAVNVQASSGGQYSVVVSNSWGTAVSSNATLTVNSSLAGVNGGKLIAWGSDNYGETDVPLDLYNVVAVAAGGNHTLALRNDGMVFAWGYGHYDQTAVPGGLNNAVAIAGGDDHSVALRADGTVLTWGYHTDAGYAYSMPAGLNNVVAIAAGGDHNLALRADGMVVAWGDNDCGQSSVPAGLSNVIAVAAGRLHSLALRADGTVVAWGEYFDFNQNLNQMYVPPGLNNVVAIAAGGYHNLALQADGNVVEWGENSFVPARLGNVMALAAGAYHSIAVRSDGTVIEWAGAGFFTNSPANLSNVVAVAAGYYNSMALIGARPNLPVVTQQPAPIRVLNVESATLSVNVIGPAPFTYQWYVGTNSDTSQPIAGATNASYITSPSSIDLSYWVRIANSFGPVDSQSALVTIANPSADLAAATDNNLVWYTGGDNYNSGAHDYATGFQLDVYSGDTYDGVDAALSFVTAYLHGYGDWHSGSAWLQTTVTGPGLLTFWWKYTQPFVSFSCGYNVTIDSVYQSALSYTVTNWTKCTYSIPAGTHTLRWNNYVNPPAQGTGIAYLDQVTFVPGNTSPPVIVVQPTNLTAFVGASVQFVATVSSFPPLACQWFKNTAKMTNNARICGTTNSSLTISNLALTDAGNYYLTVSNNVGGAISSNAVLVVVIPDTNKPVLAITSPTMNQRWSNSVFVVKGTASDNRQVSNVWCQANGLGWHLATTTNNWTNWTATAELISGTNALQAYALDTSGNNSTTNNVSFQFVVTNQLQVFMTGLGTIVTNYNNSWLEMGRNYSMTATPATGFRFTNWTGSSITTAATLNFMMDSNLTFTANFVDTNKPVFSIINLSAGQRWSNAVFTVRGTAGDNWQVTNVWYQFNGQAWSNAVTANAWTNWSATLNLVPGTNSIQAYAADSSGNNSAITNLRFDFVVTSQLQIRTTGLGTVSLVSNVWLEIGRNYSITSTPASGFVFTNWLVSTNWIGAASVTGTNLQIMMQSNLTLQANFLDVTKPTISITVPTANQKMTNALVTGIGTANDNWRVSNVWYQLNNGAWSAGTTTNGFTKWTTPTLTLFVGTNTLKAYAVDLAGISSLTNSVSFVSSNTFALQLVFTNALPLKTNGLVFSLQLSTGLNGQIQVSTNLTSWATLTNFIGTNSTLNFRDAAATNSTRRFYRAVIP